MDSFNEGKFRELVLYVASRCESLPRYGKTKLYKILFYSDFEAYRRTGRSITGARYLAWERGPVPETGERRLIEDAMVQDRDLALRRRGLEQRYVALREPDLGVFSAAEIAIEDDAITKFKDDSATAASERSHTELLAWRAGFAEFDATGHQVHIPYGAAHVSAPTLDEADEAHAADLARRHHWPG